MSDTKERTIIRGEVIECPRCAALVPNNADSLRRHAGACRG